MSRIFTAVIFLVISINVAQSVYANVQKLETVATDLFEEWRREANGMESADLKRRSSSSLQVTQNKYNLFLR